MSFDNTVTVVGNLTRDPELRFTNGGVALCEFSIAWNQKSQNGEDKPHFFEVTCWRDLAEHAAESFHKGDRVIVYGRLDHSTWETDGVKKTKVAITAEDAGLSVAWVGATAHPKEKRASNPGAGHASLPGRDQKNEEPF